MGCHVNCLGKRGVTRGYKSVPILGFSLDCALSLDLPPNNLSSSAALSAAAPPPPTPPDTHTTTKQPQRVPAQTCPCRTKHARHAG